MNTRNQKPEDMEGCYYYHAGAYYPSDDDVIFSRHTRLTAETAEREAIKLARSTGKPFVEYWDRDNGLYPGDADCVLGSWYV